MNNTIQKETSLTLLKIAAIIIIFAGIYFAKGIVVPFLLALFISIISAQPILWLEKKKVPKGLSIFIILISILGLFFGLGYLAGDTISSFTTNVPKYEDSLKELSIKFVQKLNNHGVKVSMDQFSKLFEPSRILNFTVQALNGLFSMMGNFFLIFLIILFMLLELGSIPVKIRAIFKGPKQSFDYLTKIVNSIRHYLGIKTIMAIATSLLLFIALSIIGLDYAIIWALIAGLMSYIPQIGSIIAIVPALLFALVQLSMGGIIWTIISFLAVNNILGNFIEPRIMGRGLGLSPLVVFMSLIFWGFVLGPIGMILSVPLTITIKIVLEQNENTKWMAILLGTPKDAKIHIKNRDKEAQKSKEVKPKI